MSGVELKENLLRIAESVTPETSLEEIYEQLSLLNDIDESEKEIERGEVTSHEDVKKIGFNYQVR